MIHSTIDSITAEQSAILASACDRWRKLALSVDRIDRSKLSSAVARLYREFSLDEPTAFLFFDSPQAALDAYPSWAATTGRVATFLWNYQLPLFDPNAYWRKHSGWRDLDLAIARKPNVHGCYAFGQALPGDGSVLSHAAHAQIWDAVLQDLAEPDWCETLVRDMEDHDAMQALADRVDDEEPSSPVGPMDYIALGPQLWLLREVAALEFASTLGCRTNRELLEALLGTLLNGSLLLTFERIVVAIDRPVAFENQRPTF